MWTLGIIPIVYIIYAAETGQYGVDAGKAVVHSAGNVAVYFYITSLLATPMLRIFKSRLLMLNRRALGLWTLFYSVVHLSFYLLFLLPSFAGLWEDIIKRPYITIGFLALLVLILLGITSTKSWQRRLKRNWNRLHKMTYAIGFLIVIHWYMTLRSDLGEWLFWSIAIAVPLGWRLYKRIFK